MVFSFFILFAIEFWLEQLEEIERKKVDFVELFSLLLVSDFMFAHKVEKHRAKLSIVNIFKKFCFSLFAP